MKVTDDLKYMTCSRLPILMGVGHPNAPSKNELLRNSLTKRMDLGLNQSSLTIPSTQITLKKYYKKLQRKIFQI